VRDVWADRRRRRVARWCLSCAVLATDRACYWLLLSDAGSLPLVLYQFVATTSGFRSYQITRSSWTNDSGADLAGYEHYGRY